MTEECITCHEPRLMYEFHDPCRSCRAISTSCLMCPVEPCYCLPNMTLLSRNDKRKAEGDLKLNALLCSAFNDKPAVASNGTICALRVNGEKVEVSVHESDALEDVKNEIAEAFKFKGHGGTLKLFFGNEEIKDGQQWGETGVPPGSCVQVVLQMWSQNSRPVETVTLALSWECIGRTRYLNGSALLYSGSTRMKTVDFFDGNHGDGHSITHSGKAYSWDLSQKLEVNFARVASSIDAIYFTLSGNGSVCGHDSYLCDFHDPTVTLLADSTEELSSYTSDPETDGNFQAVILCRAVKDCNQWTIDYLDRKCDGNHRDYGPMDTAIRAIMAAQY
eukprot:GEMP01047398.1.p1 GENE.GEMP01047398.1~~GEMP01047398.1.p1  ORF type:complete len:349 (+),score=69.40 GEMP01047398.1:51-1049(+)